LLHEEMKKQTNAPIPIGRTRSCIDLSPSLSLSRGLVLALSPCAPRRCFWLPQPGESSPFSYSLLSLLPPHQGAVPAYRGAPKHMPWQDVCTVRARRDDQRIIPQENIKKIAYESDGSGSRILLYLDLSNKLTKGNGFIDYNMMELEVCEATWDGTCTPSLQSQNGAYRLSTGTCQRGCNRQVYANSESYVRQRGSE
jgi:hypothetical protein